MTEADSILDNLLDGFNSDNVESNLPPAESKAAESKEPSEGGGSNEVGGEEGGNTDDEINLEVNFSKTKNKKDLDELVAEKLEVEVQTNEESGTTTNEGEAGPSRGLTVVSISGLTIERERPANKHPTSATTESNVSMSREGSTSSLTSRNRKNERQRSVEVNIMGNSLPQSQSVHMISIPMTDASQITSATSAANVLNVTEKTDHHDSKKDMEQSQADHDEDDNENGIEPSAQRQKHNMDISHLKEKRQSTDSESLIELNNESDDEQDVTYEDLTLDEEAMLEYLDPAEPSHGGEGSSQVTDKTDPHDWKKDMEQSQADHDENDIEPSAQRQKHNMDISHLKEKRQSTDSESLIELNDEFDDEEEENYEDLTLDEEELLEYLDQSESSHGGESSSQGDAQSELDHDELILSAEAAGQHRVELEDLDRGDMNMQVDENEAAAQEVVQNQAPEAAEQHRNAQDEDRLNRFEQMIERIGPTVAAADLQLMQEMATSHRRLLRRIEEQGEQVAILGNIVTEFLRQEPPTVVPGDADGEGRIPELNEYFADQGIWLCQLPATDELN